MSEIRGREGLHSPRMQCEELAELGGSRESADNCHERLGNGINGGRGSPELTRAARKWEKWREIRGCSELP